MQLPVDYVTATVQAASPRRRAVFDVDRDPINHAQATVLRKVLALRQLAMRDAPIVEGYLLMPELARAVQRRPLLLAALDAVKDIEDDAAAALTLRRLARALRDLAAQTTNAIDWLFYHITAGQIVMAALSLDRAARR